MRLPTKAVVLFVLLGTGCSADLEALYADEEALIAQLPAKPDDEVAAACGMCAKQECEKKRLECEKDDLCSKLLECKGKCSDPACLFECEADFAAQGEHNNFYTCFYDDKCTGDPDCADECKTEHRAWDTYDAYRACVFEDECRDKCDAGNNWQCVGKYSWIPSDSEPVNPLGLTIMVKDIDDSQSAFPGAANVNVRACRLPDNCESPVDETSDKLGIARFEALPLDDNNAFRGYLSFYNVDLPDDPISQIRDTGRPIHRELTIHEVVAPLSRYLDEFKELANVEPLPGSAHIRARIYDCLNTPASGVSLSLPDDREAVGFYSHSSVESPETETNRSGTGGYVNVIGSKTKVIRAVRSSDKVLVSEKEIKIGIRTVTNVDLYPLAKEY
jgi:hypothetical protein